MANVFKNYYERPENQWPLITNTGEIIKYISGDQVYNYKPISINKLKKIIYHDANSVAFPDGYMYYSDFETYSRI